MFDTGTFVQIVDILGDDPDIEIIFQPGQAFMTGIGLGFVELFPALIVKMVY